MNFTIAQYEQLFTTYSDFLELLVASNSHLTTVAAIAQSNFMKPNFKDDYWPQFNSQYKKIIASAHKYTLLDGEDEEIQLKLKRLIPILTQVKPIEFIEQYKKYYLTENSEIIAKMKLQNELREFMGEINPMFRYKDLGSTDYVSKFELISIDGKQTVQVYVTLDKNDELVVDVGGFYKDLDFEFEVEELRFDMLQFKTLANCVNHIMSKISLKASMKINGTRFRIGSHVFVVSTRDLAKARAELTINGNTRLFSLQGEIIYVNTSGSGKIVDKVAVRLLLENSKDKLYYLIEEVHNTTILDEDSENFTIFTEIEKNKVPAVVSVVKKIVPSVKSMPSTSDVILVSPKQQKTKSDLVKAKDDYDDIELGEKSNIKVKDESVKQKNPTNKFIKKSAPEEEEDKAEIADTKTKKIKSVPKNEEPEEAETEDKPKPKLKKAIEPEETETEESETEETSNVDVGIV